MRSLLADHPPYENFCLLRLPRCIHPASVNFEQIDEAFMLLFADVRLSAPSSFMGITAPVLFDFGLEEISLASSNHGLA